MKISEYIVSLLQQHGVRYVFGLQGSGTALQIFDALGETDGIDYVCTLHEQAAGMAADAYANISEGLGACIVDSGPAAANLLTAIAGSYYNSTPVVYIIGQPMLGSLAQIEGLRHFGYHENNLSIFSPICKYITQIHNPDTARYEIEKAVSISQSGRPGPVVIALPDDITWLQIEPDQQKGYKDNTSRIECSIDAFYEIIDEFNNAKRPVIIAGRGIRLSHAVNEFCELTKLLDCPVVPTWGGKDILQYNCENNAGTFGVQGTRCGNFTVQNADMILAIGARLDPSETGELQGNFAREAKIFSVDIDSIELRKYSKYKINVYRCIHADAKDFINELIKIISSKKLVPHDAWKEKISGWKQKYSVFQKEYYNEESVNPYVFVKELANVMDKNSVLITDTSTPRNYIFQAFENTGKQRLYTWLNYACLGYGLPAGIGACFALKNGGGGNVVTVMGDGGLQFNIQELATVAYNKLNLKIFVFDNGGFANIFHSQNKYMNGRHYGVDKAHGLPLPDLHEIACAYGLHTVCVNTNHEIKEKLNHAMKMNGPVFCLIKISIDHWTTPRRVGRDPLEDMTPKLSRDEFYQQMFVKPIT